MAKQTPLEAKSRSSWISCSRKIRRYEYEIIEVFMRGCPCPGVSAKHMAIWPLERADNQQCMSIINELEQVGIPFEDSNDARTLARRLKVENRSGAGFPRGRQQFVMYARPGFRVLQDYGLLEDRKTTEIKTHEVARYMQLLKLDGFFRHLRNSVAHGSYAECTRYASDSKTKRIRYWYFQDANSYGSITARYFVSELTIHSWIDIMKKWEGA